MTSMNDTLKEAHAGGARTCKYHFEVDVRADLTSGFGPELSPTQ